MSLSEHIVALHSGTDSKIGSSTNGAQEHPDLIQLQIRQSAVEQKPMDLSVGLQRIRRDNYA